jgi:hypothetical protein
VDCCATHFPTPVPHVERSAIVAISDESKPVVKTPHLFWQLTAHSEAIVALQLGSLIGGMEAIDHEAQTNFPKKTQQHEIRLAPA